MKIRLMILLFVPICLFSQVPYELDGNCELQFTSHWARLAGLNRVIGEYLEQDTNPLQKDSLVYPVLSVSRKKWTAPQFNAAACPSDTIFYKLEYEKLTKFVYSGFCKFGAATINDQVLILHLFDMGGFVSSWSRITFDYPLQDYNEAFKERKKYPKHEFYYYEGKFENVE